MADLEHRAAHRRLRRSTAAARCAVHRQGVDCARRYAEHGRRARASASTARQARRPRSSAWSRPARSRAGRRIRRSSRSGSNPRIPSTGAPATPMTGRGQPAAHPAARGCGRGLRRLRFRGRRRHRRLDPDSGAVLRRVRPQAIDRADSQHRDVAIEQLVEAARMLAIGPLACRAEDLMPLLQIMAGADGQDPLAVDMELDDPAVSRWTVCRSPWLRTARSRPMGRDCGDARERARARRIRRRAPADGQSARLARVRRCRFWPRSKTRRARTVASSRCCARRGSRPPDCARCCSGPSRTPPRRG